MTLSAGAALFGAQFKATTRSLPSLFYTILLPAFLFVVFGLAFSINEAYAAFFLPGMIGVMVSSDGLYAVGGVIKEYYRQGIVREFRSYPVSLFWLFSTFIMVRLIYVAASVALLVLISWAMFDYLPDAATVLRYVFAIACGFASYSFIGLMIGFWGIQDNKDQPIISIYYFLGMFLSDAFMNLAARWAFMKTVTYFLFPLRSMLEFMRGDDAAAAGCVLWVLASMGAFALMMRRMKPGKR